MSKSKTSGGEESLETFFHKLLTDKKNGGYLLLLQHSQSFAVRHVATSPTLNVGTYRRAKIRTPAENAARDWQAGTLWLNHIVNDVLLESNSSSLICLKTLPNATHTAGIMTTMADERIQVLDFALNFGWDGQDDETSHDEKLIVSLQTMLDEVNQTMMGSRSSETSDDDSSSQPNVPIAIQSLSPLFMFHGFAKTTNFLKSLQKIPRLSPIIVPLAMETVASEKQYETFQTLASASIILKDGEATLVRQGVRERSNIVRQSFTYRIKRAADGKTQLDVRALVLSSNPTDETAPPQPKDDTTKDPAVAVSNQSGYDSMPLPSPAASSDAGVSTRRRSPVKLELEQEGGKVSKNEPPVPSTTSVGPRIYMQEDDPEFDDFDEEDPDDDLEI